MKKCWIVALIVLGTTFTHAQTLFTYGKFKADAQEFLRAYNKNNSQTTAEKERSVRDYLDLYINSRLKVQEAYARGYDTLAQIRSEVENLRAQIIENYMSDPEAIKRLGKEAFDRSQKDIHVAHIFISFTSSGTGLPDSAAAKRKLDEVLSRISRNEDFLKVAEQLSDDPSAKTNRGDMGFVTVFTLPYLFENTIYGTAPGAISKPVTSKAGYHIFKNLGERKALGKIKIQQMLLAFPPGADEAVKSGISRLADSLYERVMAGDDFSSLASKFSNDYISAATGGNVPDISVGQFDPAFENKIWSLPNDGAVSKPFISTHGYHIVKRISVKPVITDPNDPDNIEALKQKIMFDDRWKSARDFIYERVGKKPGVQRMNYKDNLLWALSDSLLNGQRAGAGRSMNQQTPLFKIGDTTYTVANWIAFAQAFRYKADRTPKEYPDLMDEFVKHAKYEYYRSHLENYSDEFRLQMQEFRDGNLFFEIMQREIWNKTQADSVALMNIYNKNRDKYNWQPSAEAVVFFCSDTATCKNLHNELAENPAGWKMIAEKYGDAAVADLSRYEWTQIPGLDGGSPLAGQLTALSVNENDNTSSFAYVVKVYPDPSPRSFNEAKGLVMNDYQAWLEEQWVKTLRKKYPVVINKAVLAKISK